MEQKNFIAYEYVSKKVSAAEQNSNIDILQSLGYECLSVDPVGFTNDYVTINLRRDRKIKHKAELVKLEKKIDNELIAIARMKKEETSLGLIVCLSIGIIGTLILGGGMSLTMLQTEKTGLFILGIILGVLGICICATNDLIYKKIVSSKKDELEPKIDDGYEKITNICEQAYLLVNEE